MANKEFKILVTTEFKSEIVGKSVEEMLEGQKSEVDGAAKKGEKSSKIKTAASSLGQLAAEALKLYGVVQMLITAFTSILGFLRSSQIDVAQYVRRGLSGTQAKKFLEAQEEIYNVNDFAVKDFVLKLTAAYDVTSKDAQKELLKIANAFTQLANTSADSLDAKYIAERLVVMRKAYEMSSDDLTSMASYLQEFNKRTGATVEEGLAIFETLKKDQLKGTRAQQVFSDIIKIAQSIGVSKVETVYSELSSFLSSDRGRPLLAAMSPQGAPNYTVAQFVKNEGGLLAALQKLTEMLDTSDENVRRRLEMVSGTPDLLLALDKPEFRNLLEVIKTAPKGGELQVENVEDVAIKMLNYRVLGNLSQSMSRTFTKLMRRYQLDYLKDTDYTPNDFLSAITYAAKAVVTAPFRLSETMYTDYLKTAVPLKGKQPTVVKYDSQMLEEMLKAAAINKYQRPFNPSTQGEWLKKPDTTAAPQQSTQINNTFYLNGNSTTAAEKIASTIEKQVFNNTKLK